MGFSRAELEAYRDATVSDLVGPGCTLLFVGINPSLWTAASGAHFVRPGNRLYPALFAAGIVDRLVDASNGYRDEDRQHLLDRGVGITNIVRRATARADELTAAELVEGGARLDADVARWRPGLVAVAGITAYRVAFDDRKAVVGHQKARLAGVPVRVVPNPSGLNAHDTGPVLRSPTGPPQRPPG